MNSSHIIIGVFVFICACGVLLAVLSGPNPDNAGGVSELDLAAQETRAALVDVVADLIDAHNVAVEDIRQIGELVMLLSEAQEKTTTILEGHSDILTSLTVGSISNRATIPRETIEALTVTGQPEIPPLAHYRLDDPYRLEFLTPIKVIGVPVFDDGDLGVSIEGEITASFKDAIVLMEHPEEAAK